MAILEKCACWYVSNTSNKVWAAWYTDDGIYKVVWGRRDSTLQSKTERLGFAAARAKYQSKVGEKLRAGYTMVDWANWGDFGIPDPGPVRGQPVAPAVARPPQPATPPPTSPGPEGRKEAFKVTKAVPTHRKRREW